MAFSYLTLIILLISLLNLQRMECVELNVGEDKGWVTPSPNKAQFYNDWASKNRFQVNDTLRFSYEKDSVVVVREEEYEKCRSSHPMFFSNNGDTVFRLDGPGLFYFISGVSGHCQKGLKMIVKVLDPPPPPPSLHKSAATAAAPMAVFVFVFGMILFI